MLHDDFNTLRDVRFVQFHEAGNLPLGVRSLTAGVVLDFFIYLIEGIVSCVVLQHIKNEALFNGLLHRVNVERLALSLGI